jgi:hypothetical protein
MMMMIMQERGSQVNVKESRAKSRKLV